MPAHPDPATTGLDGWPAVLRLLDRSNRELREALARSDLETMATAAFVPPPGLGPVPPELREELLRLLAETTDLERELAQAMATLGAEAARLRKANLARTRGRESHAASLYFDQSC